MKLAKLIDSYISFKRNIGMRFNAESRALRAFSKALGDVDITEVERKQVLRYINGQGPVTFFWHRKYEALTGFYRFAIARGYIAESPLPTVIPKRPKAFVPYIYSSEEMRALLGGVEKVCAHKKCPIDAATFRTLLVLLWGTGLRIGEALHLTVTDVDLPLVLLTVRDTKFFKTRLVPIDPQLAKVLATYGKSRVRRPIADSEVSFFSPPDKELR